MTITAKIALVEDVRDQYGVALPLRVVGLARSTWHYRQTIWRSYEEKHAHLRHPLEKVARRHPEYGYRRATTELADTHEESIDRKVVQRLHRLWDLPLIRGLRPPRPSPIRSAIASAGHRANLVARLEMIAIFEVFYTDFTEIRFARGKAFLIVIVDHASKLALGWGLGKEKTTEIALQAWKRANRTLRKFGLMAQGRIIHHDQDSIFTSYDWIDQVLRKDGAKMSYALRGPSDNPEMESFNGRFKGENRSLFEGAGSLQELSKIVQQRLKYYNCERRHSSIGNLAPLTLVKELLQSR
jgi:putative transposase